MLCICIFTNHPHQIVGGINGHMVPGIVAQSAPLNIQLDMHAVASRVLHYREYKKYLEYSTIQERGGEGVSWIL
jgi:hypothetical protein